MKKKKNAVSGKFHYLHCVINPEIKLITVKLNYCAALEAQINGLVNGLMVPMMLVDVNFHDL